MSLDMRSRSAAHAAREQFGEILPPDPRTIADRTAQQRFTRAWAGALGVAAVLVVVVVAVVVRSGPGSDSPRGVTSGTAPPELTKHFLYGGVEFAYGITRNRKGELCLRVESRRGSGGICTHEPLSSAMPGVVTTRSPGSNGIVAGIVRPEVTLITLEANGTLLGSTEVKRPDPGDDVTFFALPLQRTTPFRLIGLDAAGNQLAFHDVDPLPRRSTRRSVEDACTARSEQTIARGDVGTVPWHVTADASTQQRRALIITYIDGQTVGSSCVDPDAWQSVIENGASGWSWNSNANGPGGSGQSMWIVEGIVPLNARRVVVTLDSGRVIRSTLRGRALGLPFQYFVTAISNDHKITDIEALDGKGRTVVTSSTFPDGISDERATPFPAGTRLMAKVNKDRVDLPLRRPGS
jgi:hypothetical protein